MDSFFFGGGFSIMFFTIFILVAGIIVFTLVRGITQWSKNNHSPKLTVPATVVAKRMQVRSNMSDVNAHTSTYTHYYVTFEVESGDRMELNVDSNEYGYLVEGDRGRLTFQGTRYLSFERQ